MALTCARLGCPRTAVASLQFDSPGSRVLLIDLVDSVEGIPICAAHASTRTPPMGWTLVDLRSPQTQMEMWEGAGATTYDGPTTRPSVRRPGDPSFPWHESAEREHEPASPLLARAFRAS